MAPACNSIAMKEKQDGDNSFGNPRGGLERLKSVFVYMFPAIYRWKKKTESSSAVIICRTRSRRKIGFQSSECTYSKLAGTLSTGGSSEGPQNQRDPMLSAGMHIKEDIWESNGSL
jgi:hypothetical protein